MRTRFYLIFILTVATLVSCKDYDSDIADINNRLDKIENEYIAAIESQITGITSTITKLENADKELQGYITALQTSATSLQEQISATNAKSIILGSFTSIGSKVIPRILMV